MSDWDFVELCRRSAEATLLSYHFSDGLLAVSMRLYADERTLNIYLPTTIVQGIPLSTKNGRTSHTCCIYGINLRQHLTVNHGMYVPAAKFEQMTREIRNGIYLAYGKRASSLKWYVSVSGTARFVGCLVRNIEDIWWEFE